MTGSLHRSPTPALTCSLMTSVCLVFFSRAANEAYAAGMHQSPRETVARVLKKSYPKASYEHKEARYRAQELKSLGAAAIPLLAEFATANGALSYEATRTMLELDPEAAAPFLLTQVPHSINHMLVPVIMDYYVDYVWKSGKPFTHTAAMHDAAIRLLASSAESPAGRFRDHFDIANALLAISLTGTADDVPLLEHYDQSADPVIHQASRAALARLGNEQHLRALEERLKAAIPSPMTEAYAGGLIRAISDAAFSNNPRFIPLLCRHLHDPMATPEPGAVDIDPYSAFPNIAAGKALRIFYNESESSDMEAKCRELASP